MSQTVLIFGKRKEGMTLEAFREYYEKQHIPLLQKLMGEHFPHSHTRHYVDHGNQEVFMGGSPSAFPWDVVAQITYSDKASRDAALAMWQDAEFAATVAKDEEAFADRSSLLMVDVGTSPTITTGS